MMRNGFYITLKDILKYLSFCPDNFGHVGKRLDEKAKVKFKIYGVINWGTNNYNTHITQYESDNDIWSACKI